MKTTISFRHMESTEALKTHLHDKLTKIEKYLHPPIEVHAVLSVERYLHCAEIQVHSKQFQMHAHEKSEDMYASIDRAIAKLEKTARRHKEKVQDLKTQAGDPPTG